MTNKFISMMDGFRQGIASSFGTRLLRFDSVSIVSRQSLLPILLLCLTLFVGVGQMWGADATDVVAMKGFASITADGYQNITKSGESENGIDMVAYGYIGSSGQVRGSKTAIAGASVTSSDANKNWSLYNSEAMPGAISKIVVTQTATGTNKFQNTLYVSLGTSSQGNVTAVTSAQAQDNTSGAQTITFTIDATKNYTYFKLLSTAKFTSGSVSDVKVTITYEVSEGSNPTLSSIQVSGTPSKKTYEQGETFDPAGLVVTAYYDDETDDNVTEDVEWSFDPATFTVVGSNKPVTVTATYEDKEDSETYDDITVTEHVVTPGEYAISLNNVLYGTTAGANITVSSVSATKNDITIVSGATSGTKPRTDAACIRYYQNNYLTFSVPTGYQITSIVFAEPSADKTWNGSISVDEGTYTNSSKSWEGETNSVTFSFDAQNRIATATVTYEATCTELGSINGSFFGPTLFSYLTC